MRVERTFAFLDLSGFTALTATEGDERSVAVVEIFRHTLRRACSRRAVRIAKWLGDGAMLVAVDPAPVVACALEMQHALGSNLVEHAVAVKCGITTGPVILLEGDDYIGHAVNLAARLCDLATAGRILADPSLAGVIPPWATVADSGEVPVRGVDHPVSVIQLALAPAAAPDEPASADPICGIPLTEKTAVAVRAAGGVGSWLFCSDSCLDTWQNRPAREALDDEDWVRDPLG